MRSPMLLATLLLSLLLPAACTEMNPDTRADMWHPSGVNARNLAAMMADPADAVRGRGAAGSDSPLAIAAVQRLMDGKPKPLPKNVSQSEVGGATASAGPSGAGGS